MGITKQRAAAACRAIVRDQKELGKLLAFTDTSSNETLALLDEGDSNEAVVEFLRTKMAAGGAGPGPSCEAAAAGGAGLGPGSIAGPTLEQLLARLQQLEFADAIVWELFDYDDSNATSISVPEFKGSLLAAYSGTPPHGSEGCPAFCMLTHKYLPKGVVIAAHLWKRAWSRFCNKVGFDNIDDLRNGLLLFKPIEWAFDNSKLSIVPNTTFNPPTFQAYLQDMSLADVQLVKKLEELRGRGKIKVTDLELETIRQQLGDMTFRDVHQRNLQSDGLKSAPDPFTRVLHFQYKRALRKAAQQGWQQPDGPPPSSHASPGAWHVQRMFDSLQHDGSQ